MNADHRKQLREFVESRSEVAFEAVVRAHVDLVYSAARRIAAGDTHLAEDITQTVFADLARKAARLPADVPLSAWLYRHTFFVASSAIRTERRRRAREQEAVAMNAVPESAEPDWSVLAPHLDEVMNTLSEADRRALVLRYFDRLDLGTVGERLGVTEDTAQKRVSRALDKLKTRFAKRGISISLSALAASLLAQAVTAAPALLATKTASAVLGGVAAGTGILFAIEKMISMNTLKPIIAALALAGVATPLVLQQRALAEVRNEQTALVERASQLDQFRAENERLAGLSVDFRELEKLREEHLELLRLRGDATLLRNQLEELKREFERQRQLLLAKGVSEEELLTEEERQARRQIMIESRFVELPLDSPIWAALGLRAPSAASDKGDTLILDAEQAKLMIGQLEEAHGANISFQPRVTTKNGRQAQVKTVQVDTVVTGRKGDVFETEQMEFGPTLDLIPRLAADGSGLSLTAIAKANQFFGYDELPATAVTSATVTTRPQIQTRQLQANVNLAPGQVLVMVGGYSEGAAKTPDREVEIAPTGLFVIVTPTEIGAAGDLELMPEPPVFAPVATPKQVSP